MHLYHRVACTGLCLHMLLMVFSLDSRIRPWVWMQIDLRRMPHAMIHMHWHILADGRRALSHMQDTASWAHAGREVWAELEATCSAFNVVLEGLPGILPSHHHIHAGTQDDAKG